WHQGNNVVLHEFAHQLDGLDGVMDGTPVLLKKSTYKNWEIYMGQTFIHLRDQIRNNIKTDIDSYAATNEAEFFAVTVEEFFEKPSTFQEKHPEIYNLYQDFFKLDPVQWK